MDNTMDEPFFRPIWTAPLPDEFSGIHSMGVKE